MSACVLARISLGKRSLESSPLAAMVELGPQHETGSGAPGSSLPPSAPKAGGDPEGNCASPSGSSAT
jgi:hypothetical protein